MALPAAPHGRLDMNRLSWRLGLPLAAVVLGITAGTAAFAMRGGDDNGGDNVVAARETGDAGAGASTMAMCVEGVEDCDDMVVVDQDGCAPEECYGEDANCAADACDRPQLAPEPTCAVDIAPEACARNAAEECVTLETDPPTIKCTSFGCDYYPMPLPMPMPPEDIDAPQTEPGVPEDGVVTILPAPVDGEVVDPASGDDGTTPEEVLPTEPPVCVPVDDCGPQPLGEDDVARDLIARCLPPDCAVSDDGAIACPDPLPCVIEVDPAEGVPPAAMPCDVEDPCLGVGSPCDCATNGTETFCKPAPLPDDCTVNSDGGVACPGSPPIDECVPGPAVDCGVIPGGTGGSSGAGTSSNPGEGTSQ
jgi:hypothetical protein